MDEERADVSQQLVSKLRARNAAIQAEKDPRYKGKKVLRKDLKKQNQVEFDPELTKYFAVEDDEVSDDDNDEDNDSDDDDHNNEDDEDEESEADEESYMDVGNEPDRSNLSPKQNKMTAESDESSEGDESDDEEADEVIKKYHKQLQKEQAGVT